MTDDPLARDLKLSATAKGFEPPAKVLCKGCPWSKEAVPGALGGWTPMMYLQAAFGPADIACHMSKNFDGHVENHMNPDANRPRSCAGLCGFRSNIGIQPAHPLSSTAAAIENISEEAKAQAFDNPSAFVLHHETPEGRKEAFWRPDRAGCGTRNRSGSGEADQ